METVRRLREIPGVAGVHVMAFGYERGVPEILRRAGLGPRLIGATTTDGARSAGRR